jgi:hypothetical protein
LLLDILPSKYYRHWSLLVGALNYLSLFEYEKDELVSIDKILKEFVNQTSSLYSKETIKINLHQVLHLIKCDIQLWGPLWTHSAFPFESMNGILVSFIHGTKKFPKSAIKNVVYMQQIDGENRNITFKHESTRKIYQNLVNSKR